MSHSREGEIQAELGSGLVLEVVRFLEGKKGSYDRRKKEAVKS